MACSQSARDMDSSPSCDMDSSPSRSPTAVSPQPPARSAVAGTAHSSPSQHCRGNLRVAHRIICGGEGESDTHRCEDKGNCPQPDERVAPAMKSWRATGERVHVPVRNPLDACHLRLLVRLPGDRGQSLAPGTPGEIAVFLIE